MTNPQSSFPPIGVPTLDLLNVGDKVTIHPAYRKAGQDAVHEIVKSPVGRSNKYHAKNLATGQTVCGPIDVWVMATDGEIAASANVSASLPLLYPGTVVTVSGPGWKRPADERYVVIGWKAASNTYQLAKLGGDKGRVWPKIPREYLTAVSV